MSKSTVGGVIGTALGGPVGGLLGAVAGKAKEKKKKKLEPEGPGDMPLPDSAEVEEAKRRSLLRQKKRKGRAYTIMTE